MKVSDIIARRYELREALGGGGLGQVFRAFDEKELREVAVKVLDPARCPAEALRRYEALVVGAARAKHPAVAPCKVQAALDGAPPLAVGELLGGEDLDALRGRSGPLPWPRACEIVATCAEALAAVATTTGAAHRALKPGNIRVREGGEVRLLDFGIAELGVQAVPARGEVYVEYRAPEQLEGAPGDARSDVFTLGVLLFEMVTGVHPFAGPSTFKVMHKVLLQAAPRPSELDPPRPVPATVEALLVRALARRPADRFADPAELGKVLALVRRASGAELAPAAARRPVVSAVDDDPDSIATATGAEDDPSTMLRRVGDPIVTVPAVVPAVVPAAAPVSAAVPRAAPPPAVAPAPVMARARAVSRAEVARGPVIIAAPAAPTDPPLLGPGDATEVVTMMDRGRGAAAPSTVVEDPSTVVVTLRDAPTGERTEVLPSVAPAPDSAADSQEMVDTTFAVAASRGRSPRRDGENIRLLSGLAKAPVARPELPTMALPGERRPQEPAPRSLTPLVVLNVVLVALAAAGIAWVMLG